MRLDPSSGPARFFRRGLLVHRHRHERCEPKCGERNFDREADDVRRVYIEHFVCYSWLSVNDPQFERRANTTTPLIAQP